MKERSFGGIKADDVSIIHDSTKALFRDPVGAVPCGTEITFSLRTNGLYIEQALLCMLTDAVVERIPLDAGKDGFLHVRYTAPDSGGRVLWYWFEVELQGGALCYYGADQPYMSGLGRLYHNPPPAFQFTVYDADFETPDWVKTAVLYQIFPDRFRMGDEKRVRAGIAWHRDKGRAEIELHEKWDSLPVYEAKEGSKYYMPSDIFGGDLEGIRQQLPYLKSLGVTLLYLNPIFESASNHRYNTGDYLNIDPILGDAGAFRKLVSEAKEAGIRIILDGVFSHTGDDSLYFNKYGRYEGAGAYQSAESPYFSWYRFAAWPDRYASWWGFESLPEVDEQNPAWQSFVITGEDSVVKRWIHAGAAGYRLDVADELPDETIGQIRAAVKEADPEAFLLGEVWEDATTKQSYGKPRTYALGGGLDAVMNYPFRNHTIAFLTEKIDARLYVRFLTHQRHVYPAPMYYSLMNLISSHDVSRIRSLLSKEVDPDAMGRGEQAQFKLSDQEYALGGARQRLAAAIQFSLPGIPSVYYGDEVGMTGLLDPFNRRAYAAEDEAILEWYRRLGELRQTQPVLQTGHVRFFSTNGDVLGILRYTVNGRDFFGKEIAAQAVLTVINPQNGTHRIVIALEEAYDTPVADEDGMKLWQGTRKAVSLLTGLTAPLEKGLLEIDIPPLTAEIFRLT